MNARRIAVLLLALSALVALAACRDRPAALSPPTGPPVGVDGGGELPLDDCPQIGVNVPDPITLIEYPNAIRFDYLTNAADDQEGVIYLPGSKPSTIAGGSFPLVIILYATGYQYTWYEELQKHLAHNGFAAASINWDPFDDDNAVNVMLDHILWLLNDSPYKASIDNNVALVGHSRGGKYVVRQGHLVANQGVNVNAIAALAPAPQNDVTDVVVPYPSRSVFVALSAFDDDPAANGSGRTTNAFYFNVKLSGFYTYDAAGPFANEFSTIQPGLDFRKMMLYIDDGGHYAWSSIGKLISGIGPVPQRFRDMAQGYLNAYLRFALRGQTIYLVYLKGLQQPPALDPTIDTSHQYSSNRRLVVENFEDSSPATNTAGGANNFLGGVVVQQDASVTLDTKSPHATKVAHVTWNGDVPRVVFNIPSPPLTPENVRNASGSTYLSIRAGCVKGDPLNTDDEDQDYYVMLQDGSGKHSPLVKMSEHGGVHYPFWNGNGSPVTHSEMATVLVPLCRFTGIDLSDVAKVEFIFNVPGHTQGKIQIDSIEFVK